MENTSDFHKQQVLLHNRREIMTELWIEPWGDRIIMEPDNSYYVVGVGPSDGSIEIRLADDSFAVYGWSGSRITIFDGSLNKLWESPVPVP